jgi:saccharopine dehydrogenase-like NADP-dependent oxidoreductase
MKRVLLIGSTGTFGKRLAAHLAKMPRLHLFLASRSKERAQEIETRSCIDALQHQALVGD